MTALGYHASHEQFAPSAYWTMCGRRKRPDLVAPSRRTNFTLGANGRANPALPGTGLGRPAGHVPPLA